MFISRLLKASSIRLVSEFLGMVSFLSGTSDIILLIFGICWLPIFFSEAGTGFATIADLVVSGVVSLN